MLGNEAAALTRPLGLGDKKSAANYDTPEGRQQNRSVELANM